MTDVLVVIRKRSFVMSPAAAAAATAAAMLEDTRTLYDMLCPIHTADTDAMKLFCRVGVGAVNTQLAHDDCRRIRSTIWKLAKQTP